MENSRFKFRAWLKETKEMIQVYDISWDKEMINTEGAWRYFDEIELMQYTGLKDKNDVEIYEGDILQTDRYPGENYYIEIAVDEDPPHNFIYGWRKKPNATVRGISDGIYTILESERNFKDSEIIGNIYMNPELLEVE